MFHIKTMILLHDNRIPAEYISGIKRQFPNIEYLSFEGSTHPDALKVYDSIIGHPDIYFFQIDSNTLIYSPSVHPKQLISLKESGVELIEGQKIPFGKYPETALYNALRIGDHVFHNFDFTDSIVIDEIKKRGLKRINVKQGYVRCSVLALGDRALITSDLGVLRAARKEGLDVLHISTGSILLPGEKYGFLGGTGGMLPGDGVIFLGDIRKHPDISGIDEMFKKHGRKYYFCENLPLYDAGGLFVF